MLSAAETQQPLAVLGDGCGSAYLPSHSWERIVPISMGIELGAASWGWGQAGWLDGQTDGFFPPVVQAGVPSDSLNQYNCSQ